MEADLKSFQPAVTAVLLLFFSLERIFSTFTSKTKSHKALPYDQAFTSLMLFLYASCVISSTLFFFTKSPLVSRQYFGAGFLFLIFGIIIRKKSMRALGDDWSVFISASSLKKVAVSGPFRWSRHPYYWASLLELTGVALLLGCNWAIFIVCLLYLPLVITRSILEERELILKFGQEYQSYKSKTPFFIFFK